MSVSIVGFMKLLQELDKFLEARLDSLTAKGLLGRCLQLYRTISLLVWQELKCGRLMRDEDGDLLRMPGDEVETDERANAAAKYKCGFVRQGSEQTVCIVTVRRERQTFTGRVDLTP
jgi:hypothetical protein